jgi:hypothetical protein
VLGQAVVSVEPSSQTVKIPNDAEINITVTGVSNLYGIQFDLYFDPTLFDYHLSTPGDFLNEGIPTNAYNTTPETAIDGEFLKYASTRMIPGDVSGSGNLVTINLTPELFGTGYINLTNVKLSDINSQSIPATVINGTAFAAVCLIGESPQPCLTSPPQNNTGQCFQGTKDCVGNLWDACTGKVFESVELCGDSIDNDCDGEGEGDDTEEFPNLGNTCWNGLGECNESGSFVCTLDQLSTECDAVPGTPGTETCPSNYLDDDCNGRDNESNGDINCNNCVNIFDLTTVGGDFGYTSSDFEWTDPIVNASVSDIIVNLEIDIFDLVMVGASFGNEYGTCTK